jgi:predicted nucleotidyltransferase
MLRAAFEALIAAFNDRQIQYAIIGGLAIVQYARVRTTDDIDAILAVSQLSMPGLFDDLKTRGFEVDVMRNVRELRDGGMTTVQFGGVLIDLLRPVLPLYARVLDRAITAELLGQSVRISSVEGLIVTKLVAMRPQDEIDIQELLNAFAGKLDLEYIRSELDSFTEASNPRRSKFDAWVRQASSNQQSLES